MLLVVMRMMFKEEGSPSQITELDKIGVVVIILYSIGNQAAGSNTLSLTHGILVGMVHRIGRLPINANFLPPSCILEKSSTPFILYFGR
jgi:hypothetical protein